MLSFDREGAWCAVGGAMVEHAAAGTDQEIQVVID